MPSQARRDLRAGGAAADRGRGPTPDALSHPDRGAAQPPERDQADAGAGARLTAKVAVVGAEVVVLDCGAPGAGVSLGNTGWICPSITAPLPGPGMVREGLRQLITRGDA